MRDCTTIFVAKTKALISCTADLRNCFLICEKQVFSDAFLAVSH